MTNLPVITGLGGVNAAGRSSGNHSYRRIIFESLSETEKLETQLALASLMGKFPNKTVNGLMNQETQLKLTPT